MNLPYVRIVGLAALATVLAGCVTQYSNPSVCIDEMHSRLEKTSKGELSVTSRAVSYRGLRVVIEGQLDRTKAAAGSAASDVPAASAASAAPEPAGTSAHAETPATGLAATGARAAPAGSPSVMSAATSRASSGGSEHVAASAPAQPRPTTLAGELIAFFSHGPRKAATPIAAECTFDGWDLKSFRWLAPAELAKTTPAPTRSR